MDARVVERGETRIEKRGEARGVERRRTMTDGDNVNNVNGQDSDNNITDNNSKNSDSSMKINHSKRSSDVPPTDETRLGTKTLDSRDKYCGIDNDDENHIEEAYRDRNDSNGDRWDSSAPPQRNPFGDPRRDLSGMRLHLLPKYVVYNILEFMVSS